MIYQTIGFSDFAHAFETRGRAAQFTPDGLRVLFDYLDECSATAWRARLIPRRDR